MRKFVRGEKFVTHCIFTGATHVNYILERENDSLKVITYTYEADGTHLVENNYQIFEDENGNEYITLWEYQGHPGIYEAQEIMTKERLIEIATLGIHGLLEDDYDTAMEYFSDTMELDKDERTFFGIPESEEETYGEDDSEDEALMGNYNYYRSNRSDY